MIAMMIHILGILVGVSIKNMCIEIIVSYVSTFSLPFPHDYTDDSADDGAEYDKRRLNSFVAQCRQAR